MALRVGFLGAGLIASYHSKSLHIGLKERDDLDVTWSGVFDPDPERAAQFALAGALDRLRAERDGADAAASGAIHLLAAADPANPYGAALSWPRRGEDDRRPLQRAAGAYVVLVDGVATLYLERGGSTLQTLPAFDDPATAAAAVHGLSTLVVSGRQRDLVIRKVDGLPIAESPARAALLDAGFVAGYRGLTLRGSR